MESKCMHYGLCSPREPVVQMSSSVLDLHMGKEKKEEQGRLGQEKEERRREGEKEKKRKGKRKKEERREGKRKKKGRGEKKRKKHMGRGAHK